VTYACLYMCDISILASMHSYKSYDMCTLTCSFVDLSNSWGCHRSLWSYNNHIIITHRNCNAVFHIMYLHSWCLSCIIEHLLCKITIVKIILLSNSFMQTTTMNFAINYAPVVTLTSCEFWSMLLATALDSCVFSIVNCSILS